MWFGYLLGGLADWFGQAASFLYSKADEWADVYLLGDYVSDAFRWLADIFTEVKSNTLGLQDHWGNIYDYIQQWIDARFDVFDLLDRKWDILDFFEDIWGNVRTIAVNQFPFLDDLLSDPLGFIRPFVEDVIGDLIAMLNNLENLVKQKLDDLIPDSFNFFGRPWEWVADRLRDYRADVGTFLDDPSIWFMDRLDDINPNLDDFLRDPVAFVTPRLIAFLKARVGAYKDRLVDLATDILDAIF